MLDNRGVIPRFYAPDSTVSGDVIELPPDEAAHLVRVLRLGVGAPIHVFDGRGHAFDAAVEAIARGRVHVRLGGPCAAAPEPRVRVTLAQAVLKGDKMDDVVRDAVMMGAAAIQPVVTARTEFALTSLHRGRRRERWERIAVASVKQCGRATVPPILEPLAFTGITAALAALTLPGPGLMFVEPSAADAALTPNDLGGPPPRDATVLIGPEGGWTTQEVEEAAAACRLLTLGGRTLRADAMALVALASLFTAWNDF
jgi:16S rRNA (uracil1498-N3)-methyltransferase